MIDLTDSPFIQVVFDLEVPRMVFGQICLIGDAAFTPGRSMRLEPPRPLKTAGSWVRQ